MVELQIYLIACSFYTVNKIDVFTIDIYCFYKKLKKFMFKVFLRKSVFKTTEVYKWRLTSLLQAVKGLCVYACVYMYIHMYASRYVCVYVCVYMNGDGE